MKQNKAVILISGGLDSATTFAMAKACGYDCYALSFDYGQKNRAELQAAQRIAKQFNAIEHKTIRLSLDDFKGSALTDDQIKVPKYQGDSEIPATYVPARNTVFLSIALAWAEVLEAQHIFTGVCAVDYSGYPDCRPEYIESFNKMANLATRAGVEGDKLTIHTPLIYLSKAETIIQGIKLGVDYSQTVSCYQADEHGRACGQCDSCALRKKGFKQAGMVDPTIYQPT